MAANETMELALPYMVFKQVLHAIEILLIIGGNALTLLAVNRTKKSRVIPTNTFIVSLALSDGLVGVFLPFIIVLNFAGDERVWAVSTCALRGPYFASFSVSLATLLAIAVDRYVAVVHPLYYKSHMTVRIARITVFVVWFLELLVIMPLTCYYGMKDEVAHLRPEAAQDIFPKELYFGLLQTIILLPIVGNVILYTLIYVDLIRRRRSLWPYPEGQNAESSSMAQPSKKTKVFTKMMALVLGYLILAWSPYYVLVPIHNVKDPSTPEWYIYMYDVSVILFYSNSFMNPIIYSWKSRDFKDAYLKILKCGRWPNAAETSASGTTVNTVTIQNTVA